MKKIAITGAGGAIGQSLVRFLENLKEYALVLNYTDPAHIPQDIKNNSEHEIVCGVLEDEDVIQRLLQDADCLIHLAQPVNPLKYAGCYTDAYHFGMDPTLKILDYLKTRDKEIHILYPSSGGTVYSESDPKCVQAFRENDSILPVSPYGMSKVICEHYIRFLTQANPHVTCNILRIANPYGVKLQKGRKQGLIDTIINNIKAKEKIELWGDMSFVRDYIYIDDLNHAFLNAMEYKNGFDVFNIGSGIGHSIADVIRLFEELLGEVDYQVMPSAAIPGASIWNVLDITKARTQLNWAPQTDLKQGIKNVWQNAA